MSKEKKLTILRLAIFFAIAFIPVAVIAFAMKAYFGDNIFASKNPDVTAAAVSMTTCLMCMPAFAALITRLATKEGFKNSYLGFSPKGKWKYYLVSLFLKPVEVVLNCIIICLVFLKGFSPAEILGDNISGGLARLFMQFAVSVIMFFPAFGEEWGWRGYMMPKLIELMGKPAAVVVGGIIWGLWHAPFTVQGHNFGVDYVGFPYVGIALMCAFCVAMNALLTWLTERTKSIYPASFCHMINNNCSPGVLMTYFFSAQAYAKVSEQNALSVFFAGCGLSLVIGVVFFVLLCRKEPAEK